MEVVFTVLFGSVSLVFISFSNASGAKALSMALSVTDKMYVTYDDGWLYFYNVASPSYLYNVTNPIRLSGITH